MSEERIVRYTRENLPKDTRTDWARVDAMTEEELTANALSDPDNPPLTEEDLERMLPRLPSGLVCLRLDDEVVRWLMAQPGSPHERVNAILREHMAAQQAGAQTRSPVNYAKPKAA